MSEKIPSSVNLGESIRAARRQRGWSQEVLAEQAGVSRPTIARVETGNDVSTATISKIVSALGLTLRIEPTE
ncbi:helix-turn-helix transcriptional regulator [Kocuria rosea]|uniref:helix-turn-helix transcriptional regulator n=1 Tax=Kocuria rosea TaxID=1275 RepID=UPI0025B76AB3|nr:helix-turn-helix transcriptional regulator [Kocuria rosea]WJZ68554.1 helix-turn-helix transcriptional regulator [Kocuria rosea]